MKGGADQGRTQVAVSSRSVVGEEGLGFPAQALIAVVAIPPLPGSPRYGGSVAAVVEGALADIEAYRQAGVDAILLENSWDVPYVKPPLPEAALALVHQITREMRGMWRGLAGLQLLEAANEEALAIAASASLDFIRAEGYVFAHIGGAGLIEGCAGRLLRRRRELGADHVRVVADIKKKHCAHALTADLSLADIARQADLFLADGLVLTGSFTGEPPQAGDFRNLRGVSALPLWVGSGMTPENIGDFLPLADAFIVGSTLRHGGKFLAPTDSERLRRFVDEFQALRAGR
jgi:uncharacterized protein